LPPIFIVQQNMVGISAVMLVVFYRRLGMHIRPLCENVTSSTETEVHNVSQRRQKRTEPRPHATGTQNWWRFAVSLTSYASGQTNRQTYLSQYFPSLLWVN